MPTCLATCRSDKAARVSSRESSSAASRIARRVRSLRSPRLSARTATGSVMARCYVPTGPASPTIRPRRATDRWPPDHGSHGEGPPEQERDPQGRRPGRGRGRGEHRRPGDLDRHRPRSATSPEPWAASPPRSSRSATRPGRHPPTTPRKRTPQKPTRTPNPTLSSTSWSRPVVRVTGSWEVTAAGGKRSKLGDDEGVPWTTRSSGPTSIPTAALLELSGIINRAALPVILDDVERAFRRTACRLTIDLTRAQVCRRTSWDSWSTTATRATRAPSCGRRRPSTCRPIGRDGSAERHPEAGHPERRELPGSGQPAERPVGGELPPARGTAGPSRSRAGRPSAPHRRCRRCRAARCRP